MSRQDIRVSKNVPQSIARWVETHSFAFSLATDLYGVSTQSDRLIRANRLGETDAASAIADWALAKLAIHGDFDDRDWEILLRTAGADSNNHEADTNSLCWFLLQVSAPAVGGGTAYRKRDGEKAALLKRIDELALELLKLVEETIDTDITLGELGALDSGLQPLIVHSSQLMASEAERFRRSRAHDPIPASAEPTQNIQPTLGSTTRYFEPRLSLYLRALRMRFAGKLPIPVPQVPPALVNLLEGICEDDLSELGAQFGILGLGKKNRQASPRFFEDGEFGKYPSQRKALRKAVMLKLAAELCPPLRERLPRAQSGDLLSSSLSRDRGKFIKYSRANLIEKITLAWFGDAPDLKDINTLLKPFRHGGFGARGVRKIVSGAGDHPTTRADATAETKGEKVRTKNR